MSKLNKIFNSIPVTIPDRSGFDLSHESIGTATTGTVIPVTHFEVLPGDTISMGSMLSVSLPPFAVPFKGRIDAELTAAFIPYRLIWSGWQNFITQNPGYQTAAAIGTPGSAPSSYLRSAFPLSVPVLTTGDSFSGDTAAYDAELAQYLPGSLADYLGVKAGAGRAGAALFPSSPNGISALPFLAYHKFCDDWIRDDNNMKPYFSRDYYLGSFPDSNPAGSDGIATSAFSATSAALLQSGRYLPFVNRDASSRLSVRLQKPNLTGYSSSDIAGVPMDLSIGLGDLRQRCWAKDYFTTATTRPQAGAAAEVAFSTSAATGSFTISSLRAAESLQRWLERNNIAGTDYGSQILAHFGVTPPDATLNRSVLLGSFRTPVMVNAVENNSNAEATSTRNPFGSALGSAAGFGSANESGKLIDDFSPKEHGIIMVFFTLIPHAYYNSGIDRQLLHINYGDFAWPEFAGIGDQPIYGSELNTTGGSTIFGYNQRYSEMKFKLDRISGLLEDGSSLDVYALQRGFSQAVPSLGSSFLEIPKDYLDQVMAVTTAQSGFSCIFDCYFDCSAIRVLPEYSLPKL